MTDELFKLLRFWQFDEVFGDKEPGVEAGGCVFDHFRTGTCAKEDADGRVVAGGHLGVAVVGDVGVELAEVFVAEFVVFEFYDDVAMEDAVVEDEVGKVVAVVDDDAFLAGFEAEAIAEFEEKFLQVVDERLFKVGFFDGVFCFESEEFKGERVFYDVGRLRVVVLKSSDEF